MALEPDAIEALRELAVASATIPRRIFQFAHTPSAIPPPCRSCMNGVQEFAAAYGYAYELLTLDDLPPLTARCTDLALPELLRRCTHLGDVSDILRYTLLHHYGGWWFDWDLRIVHPTSLDELLQTSSDSAWTGFIGDNNVVCVEFQGGAPGNPVARAFLDWLADRQEPSAHPAFFAGPHVFSSFLSGVQLLDRRLRLLPVDHVFQAPYHLVKTTDIQPSPAHPQPLFHHYAHAWSRPFDVNGWTERHIR